MSHFCTKVLKFIGYPVSTRSICILNKFLGWFSCAPEAENWWTSHREFYSLSLTSQPHIFWQFQILGKTIISLAFTYSKVTTRHFWSLAGVSNMCSWTHLAHSLKASPRSSSFSPFTLSSGSPCLWGYVHRTPQSLPSTAASRKLSADSVLLTNGQN